MNVGDVKELTLPDADTSVRIKIDRVSRKVTNDDSTPG